MAVCLRAVIGNQGRDKSFDTKLSKRIERLVRLQRRCWCGGLMMRLEVLTRCVFRVRMFFRS